MKKLTLLFVVLITMLVAQAQKKETKATVTEPKKDELPLPGIIFRNIGPAVTSGRISDFAINPS
ncbi:MAG: hypothetical protein JJE09_03715, partial [Bacteroidia bacterium]|nr:hypothetical protein [Bacteroidia bacterium]